MHISFNRPPMPFISPSKVFVYLCMCLKRQRSKGRQLTILPMTLPMREGLQSCRCVDKSNLIYKNVAYWNERTHPFWISSWSSHTGRDEWLFSLFFFFFFFEPTDSFHIARFLQKCSRVLTFHLKWVPALSVLLHSILLPHPRNHADHLQGTRKRKNTFAYLYQVWWPSFSFTHEGNSDLISLWA